MTIPFEKSLCTEAEATTQLEQGVYDGMQAILRDNGGDIPAFVDTLKEHEDVYMEGRFSAFPQAKKESGKWKYNAFRVSDELVPMLEDMNIKFTVLEKDGVPTGSVQVKALPQKYSSAKSEILSAHKMGIDVVGKSKDKLMKEKKELKCPLSPEAKIARAIDIILQQWDNVDSLAQINARDRLQGVM